MPFEPVVQQVAPFSSIVTIVGGSWTIRQLEKRLDTSCEIFFLTDIGQAPNPKLLDAKKS
jgi:hypothetical protein